MPHAGQTYQGENARRTAAEGVPFGPGFPGEVVARTVTLQVEHSSFKDSGSDWTEFKAIDENGNVIGTRRIPGY